jgi:hypothetical protein
MSVAPVDGAGQTLSVVARLRVLVRKQRILPNPLDFSSSEVDYHR